MPRDDVGCIPQTLPQILKISSRLLAEFGARDLASLGLFRKTITDMQSLGLFGENTVFA